MTVAKDGTNRITPAMCTGISIGDLPARKRLQARINAPMTIPLMDQTFRYSMLDLCGQAMDLCLRIERDDEAIFSCRSYRGFDQFPVLLEVVLLVV